MRRIKVLGLVSLILLFLCASQSFAIEFTVDYYITPSIATTYDDISLYANLTFVGEDGYDYRLDEFTFNLTLPTVVTSNYDVEENPELWIYYSTDLDPGDYFNDILIAEFKNPPPFDDIPQGLYGGTITTGIEGHYLYHPDYCDEEECEDVDFGPFYASFSWEVIGDQEPGPEPGNGAPVPEPATMLLLGSGLIGLAGFSRKKFKK